MKRNNKIGFRLARIVVLSGMAFLYACGNGDAKKKTPAVADESVTVEKKYIPIEDASEFLPEWSRDNIVVYHSIGDPDNLHPSNGTTSMRTFINDFLHRYVIANDPIELDVRPDLVESLPEISTDELEYTYVLRDGVTFDDGSPLSVDDIIFSFKAYKCPLVNNPQAKPYLENLKTIVKDPGNLRRFTMVMKRRYLHNIIFLTDFPVLQRTFLDPRNILAGYGFEQMDDPGFKAYEQQDLADWANEYNNAKYGKEAEYIRGLGAYRFEKWEPGQSITLVRKSRHWTHDLENKTIYDQSYPEKIIFKINKDANSQTLEFKSQVLDVSGFLGTKTLLELQQDENFNRNYHSRFTDSYNYTYMAMNIKPDGIRRKKLLTDVRVRKAIALLVPVDDIMMVVGKGKGLRMNGPVSPLKAGYDETLPELKVDVEAARKLLEEAGWIDTDGNNVRDKTVDGEKLSFSCDLHYMNTQAEWKDMAQMIKEALYKAGLQVNLIPLDVNVLYDRADNHDFDMMLAAWASSYAPDDFTQLWHTSSWRSKGSNFTGFGNAESDALIDSIKFTLKDSLRIPMVRKLQHMVVEQYPYVFMHTGVRKNVIHKRFGNAHMTFERPGHIVGNLKLLTGERTSAISKKSALVE